MGAADFNVPSAIVQRKVSFMDKSCLQYELVQYTLKAETIDIFALSIIFSASKISRQH